MQLNRRGVQVDYDGHGACRVHARRDSEGGYRWGNESRGTVGATDQELQRYRDPSWFVEGAEIMRMAYEAHQDDNDFVQPGTLCRQVMTPTDRDHLVDNIVGHLSPI